MIDSETKNIENQSTHTSIISNWNTAIENEFKRYVEKASGCKLMHLTSARRSKRRYERLMYMGIILGPLAGFAAAVGVILHPEEDPVFSLIAAGFGFISGIIVAITKYAKLEERTTAHRTSANQYIGLESNLRQQLALERSMRMPAHKYMQWIGSTYNKLFETSPFIPVRIYNEIVQKAKDTKFAVPEAYGEVVYINQEDTIIPSINPSIPVTVKTSQPALQDSPNDSKHKVKSQEIHMHPGLAYELERLCP